MADPARPLTEVEREARFLTGGGVTGVQVVGEKGWHFFPNPGSLAVLLDGC